MTPPSVFPYPRGVMPCPLVVLAFWPKKGEVQQRGGTTGRGYNRGGPKFRLRKRTWKKIQNGEGGTKGGHGIWGCHVRPLCRPPNEPFSHFSPTNTTKMQQSRNGELAPKWDAEGTRWNTSKPWLKSEERKKYTPDHEYSDSIILNKLTLFQLKKTRIICDPKKQRNRREKLN